jgi:hypothetical protein
MVEIKANISVQIPGGPQLNALQSLKLESYQYFDLNLELDKDNTGVIKLPDLKKSSLILIKATLVLGKESTSKLMCTIGSTGSPFSLDAPLLLLGSSITALAKDAGEITFKLNPVLKPDETVKVEIIIGWQDIDTPPPPVV